MRVSANSATNQATYVKFEHLLQIFQIHPEDLRVTTPLTGLELTLGLGEGVKLAQVAAALEALRSELAEKAKAKVQS